MAEELDWDVEAFDEAFQEVFENGMAKADFKARLVWLPNALKHNKPESPNVVRSWRVELDLLPECDLKNEAIARIREILESIGPSYVQAFDEVLCGDSRKPSSKPSSKTSAKTTPNQEQEQEQEQEDKNLSRPESKKPAFETDDLRFAEFFFAELLKLNPKHKKPNLDAWAKETRLMRERDGRTLREAAELVRWCISDPFWRTNILSVAKLRVQWDALTIKKNSAKPGQQAAPQESSHDHQCCHEENGVRCESQGVRGKNGRWYCREHKHALEQAA